MMENKEIQLRLAALKGAMQEADIDYYMIPTADFHNSEYVSDYFKVREYFSNFSGSNGTLLVWQEGAGLWTDGRYFIQAESELEGTTIQLFRMQDEGVPTILEFLRQNMKNGQTLGFDGRVIPMAEGCDYEKELADRHVRIFYEQDLAEEIWKERPAFPAGKVFVIEDRLAGKSFEEKRAEVMKKTAAEGADSLLLTKLDDIMWLFNIRGCDVECNPVAMSYAWLADGETVLFIQESALDGTVKAYLAEKQITVREYGELAEFLKGLAAGRRVLLDKRHCSYAFYRMLSGKQEIVEKQNPTELLKAVKNPVELAGMEEIYLKDSVALTKFIYWLKTNIGKIEMDEISVADKLEAFRREIPEFLELSFPSISAYRANAAMMHYEPTPEKHAVLKPEGMYLIDSGGQYFGGTTDVTRTIALGPVTEQEKQHYTKTAAGMLQLTNAHWIYGCTGRNLDILARQPLWELGIDYQCGTGHGVGYILNVHEGPQGLRWRFTQSQTEAVIEAGMDVTNEPGVYIAGSHGIRIENVMVAENDVKNEYGQFMHFKTLTWVPLDKELMQPELLNDTQRGFYRAYQEEVCRKLIPYLTPEEAAWLKEETEEV